MESVASSNPIPGGYYVVNTRDIPDRKRRERDLKRKNERLEEFASVVGHDLRNPLNVAMAQRELAMTDGDGDHLENLGHTLDRMASLIDDLLALARAGTAIDQLKPVPLEPLSEACWQTVDTADGSMVTNVDRTVLADRPRLRQLLENLVRNAVEHGSETVTVTIGELEEATGFYVEDDGPGIAENDREQVFESGYTDSADGTGLGLAICTEIAEAHGWTIDLTESTGGGLDSRSPGWSFETDRSYRRIDG